MVKGLPGKSKPFKQTDSPVNDPFSEPPLVWKARKDRVRNTPKEGRMPRSDAGRVLKGLFYLQFILPGSMV
jgi:hypothetical protein